MKSALLACLVAGLCLCGAVPGIAEVPPNPTAGSSTLAGLSEGQEIEHGNSPEEEHESNGPEGSAGVPMERLPLAGIAIAAAVIVITWRLMPREKM